RLRHHVRRHDPQPAAPDGTRRELEFVLAARAVGCGRLRVVTTHGVPQAVPSITVPATIGGAFAVLLESALSFLGLGVQPPAASWGNMLNGARGYLRTAPGLAVMPGVLIFVTVLSYNWFGDGLRDAMDPGGERSASA